MRFKLYVEMENDAFREDPFVELQRTLDMVKRGMAYKQPRCAIMDSNGNKVGEYAITMGRQR